ncbi:MAG TPA: decarboxylating 6-phosphogluconate dehydrogenase [Acidobacteriaceae bacterium]|jgi:6-phosphogluconate dehydrogenase|nr:decarboxylating 6-phosphogluconate dehydrogenase [Acidobacteriaceae bacterium]
MQLGMIGLGRMGSYMTQRLLKAGHECVVYDSHPAAMQDLVTKGASASASLADFAQKLAAPRAVWLMVPAAVVDSVLASLTPVLAQGDIVIDGGNSYYHDDIRRAGELKEKGIHYVDCGTSGGVWGLDRGYCLMIGGEEAVVEHLDPIFKSLAPGVASAARTPGRSGDPTTAENGYLRCGPNGAGHFVKMVHNGIEYGMMAAFAEGLNIIKNANAGKVKGEQDAETTPLRHPELYQFDIDVPEVAEVWRRGSVIGSWLLDLTAAALHANPQLSSFAGRVSDSGEGRWTVQAAVDEGVCAPVISAALYSRFASRGSEEYADRLLSAMRYEFGGHKEKSAGGS